MIGEEIMTMTEMAILIFISLVTAEQKAQANFT